MCCHATREINLAPLCSKIPIRFIFKTLRCTFYHYPPFLPFTMSLNATFAGSSSHHTASQLYASLNVDFTQLNWFERHWMAWYLWIGNPLIATGIASFILHEVR